jgi:hypothetical protein
MPIGFPDFAFVKEIAVPKIVGSFNESKGNTIVPLLHRELDRCILSLVSFKYRGAVGYDTFGSAGLAARGESR